MKLVLMLICLLLTGCSKHVVIIPFGFIQDQIEVSNLEGEEQCDRIHIDYRHECRAKIAKERKVVEDMSKAMQGNK